MSKKAERRRNSIKIICRPWYGRSGNPDQVRAWDLHGDFYEGEVFHLIEIFMKWWSSVMFVFCFSGVLLIILKMQGLRGVECQALRSRHRVPLGTEVEMLYHYA